MQINKCAKKLVGFRVNAAWKGWKADFRRVKANKFKVGCMLKKLQSMLLNMALSGWVDMVKREKRRRMNLALCLARVTHRRRFVYFSRWAAVFEGLSDRPPRYCDTLPALVEVLFAACSLPFLDPFTVLPLPSGTCSRWTTLCGRSGWSRSRPASPRKVRERITAFLAPPLPFCRRLTPLLVVLQSR